MYSVFLCFVTFPCGLLSQVWYLIVLILDHCISFYFYNHACILSHNIHAIFIFIMLYDPFKLIMKRRFSNYSLAVLCFVTFPCGLLSQVWYLIVLILDHCISFYFYNHACILSHNIHAIFIFIMLYDPLN